MKLYIYISILLVLFFSCKKENLSVDKNIEFDKIDYIIANEGVFNSANASLSAITKSVIQNNLFSISNNSMPLGDILSDIENDDNFYYLVINNSDKIIKIKKNDFSFVQQINGVSSPRKICIKDKTTAYFSSLTSTYISVLNVDEMKITGKIQIGTPTENLLISDSLLFASFWSNYYKKDSINNNIYIINTNDNQLIRAIKVGKEPNSMIIDESNNLWVLCSGGHVLEANNEKPSLYKINLDNFFIEKILYFDDISSSPKNLSYSKEHNKLFWIDFNVFSMSLSEQSLPNEAFLKTTKKQNNYGLFVDEDFLFVLNAKDYTSNGEILKYKISDKNIINSYTVGINPFLMRKK